MYKKLKVFCFVNPRIVYTSAMLMLLTFSLVASPVFAGGGFGDMGDNVAGQFTGLTQALKMFAYFSGFALVIVSIVLFAGMKKPGNQTPATVPVIMMVAGFALLSIMAFISMGSSSFFGSDETGTGTSALGL